MATVLDTDLKKLQARACGQADRAEAALRHYHTAASNSTQPHICSFPFPCIPEIRG
jgi:hypothetical protein